MKSLQVLPAEPGGGARRQPHDPQQPALKPRVQDGGSESQKSCSRWALNTFCNCHLQHFEANLTLRIFFKFLSLEEHDTEMPAAIPGVGLSSLIRVPPAPPTSSCEHYKPRKF